MRYATPVLSAILALAFSVSGFPQNAASLKESDPPSVDLPMGENAWAVRVVRTGGLQDDISKDITVKSTGEVIIDSPRGQRKSSLAPEALKMWRELVLSGMFPQLVLPADAISGCHDCYRTSITVRRREADGKERRYTAAWIPTTVGSVAPDFISIARPAMELAN